MHKAPEAIELPREVLDRVNRVYRFHKRTKMSFESVRQGGGVGIAEPPSLFRTFPDRPRVALPTGISDIDVPTLALLEGGMEDVPVSISPPAPDLRTLATWLHFGAGITRAQKNAPGLRSYPSTGALFPTEVYVAAFAFDGLEPGLYHFSPREFALRKLRDGPETLSRIKRGRPDLEFIKNTPGLVLVSTIFCRSTWRYRERGYRCALLDAGHLVQNLVTAAAGMGMRTLARLKVNDAGMKELIGVAPDAPLAGAECVQAMVAWADESPTPMNAAGYQATPLPPISREPLAPDVVDRPGLLEAHQDCVAPGVAVVEVRPPLTELTPLPEDFACERLVSGPIVGLQPLRDTLLSRRTAEGFAFQPLTRDQFAAINRLALRGGTCFPVKPQGAHVGLVRPFWMVSRVTGMDPGVYYYHPPTDRWTMLQPGDFHVEATYLSREQAKCGQAAAVCFLAANLHALMTKAGPDAYRLAHLEAGLVGQRMYLSSWALGLGCSGIGEFYDDEVRKFLTLVQTGWEVIYGIAVGAR